jgi:hypothetical protein
MESDSPVVVDSFWLDTNGFLYEGEAYSWSEILDIHADKHALYRLVSLAAHDAQIRAGALGLAGDNGVENGRELLNESLAEAVKEYLLYGAHPLSTEEDSDDIWDDSDLSKLRLTNGDTIDCSELADEVLDALKRYLDGRPVLQSIPTSGVEG